MKQIVCPLVLFSLLSWGTSLASTPQITSPNGGESLLIGLHEDVTWSLGTAVDSVRLELSRSGTAGPWESMVPSIPNDGATKWIATGPASQDCRVRILDAAGGAPLDTSDAAFEVIDPSFSGLVSGHLSGHFYSGDCYITSYTGNLYVDLQLDEYIFETTPGDTVFAPRYNFTFQSLGMATWLNSSQNGYARLSLSSSAAECYPLGACGYFYPAIFRLEGVAVGPSSYNPPTFVRTSTELNFSAHVFDDICGSGTASFQWGPVSSIREPGPSAGPLHLSVHPNPFESAATIRYESPAPGPVRVEVFDIAGRRVAVVQEGLSGSVGWHAVSWDGRDAAGDRVPAGVYFVRVALGGDSASLRIVRIW